MRILIDMQGAQTALAAKSEVGRYWRSLCMAMLTNPGQSEISLLLNAQSAETFVDLRRMALDHLPHERILGWQSLPLQKARSQSEPWRSAMAGLLRGDVIAAAQPDVLHASALLEGPFENAAVTIDGQIPTGVFLYDSKPRLFCEDAAHPAMNDWYQSRVRQLTCAQLLLTTNEASKREAVNLLSINPSRVVSIGVGVEESFFVTPVGWDEGKSIRERHGLFRPFILYYGGFNPDNNVGSLIEAFALAKQSLPHPHDLVLVGYVEPAGRLALQQLAARHGIFAENLRWLDDLPEQSLVDLQRACAVFAYPCLREGFGLPVLEAMAAGARVLCSGRGGFLEGAASQEITFDPARTDSMSFALVRALSGNFVGPSHAENQARVSALTWSSCARRTIEAYESLHAELKPGRSQIMVPPLGKLVRKIAALAPPSIDLTDISALTSAIGANRPSRNPPRLLLDATVQSTNRPSSGIGRVVNRITAELLRRPPHGLVVTPVRADDNPLHFRVAGRYRASLLGEAFVGEEEHVELRRGDHFLALDLYHALYRRTAFLDRVRQVGGRLSAVVYDLLPLQRPDWFEPGSAEMHSLWFDAVSQFDELVCISRTVAEDVVLELHRRLPRQRHPRVDWFHLGSELPVTPNGHLPPQISERPTVLLVSVLWQRKGHEQTLDAFEQLWKDGWDVNLVFAGRVGWGVDRLVKRLIHHPEKGKRLFWFNGPDDGILGQLYASCTGVLVASEGEGFGLPVVEALAHKRPVLARDLPIFNEIAGDSVTYFRAENPEQLAFSLRDWIEAISRGMPSGDTPALLSWPEATVQLLSALGLKET